MHSQHISLKSMRGLVLLTSVLSFAPLAGVNAQEVTSQSSPEELVRNNLEPFAGAYKEVSQIHATYEHQIVQSTDQGQADALQQEANQKMNQAVADHGLSVEDYNSMYQTIQGDPALKEEFMTVLHRTR